MKKIIPLILSTLLLTSCSGPDSSGGIEFSKTANVFPYGDCRGSGNQTHHTEKTGCGWITADEKTYYIMPNAELSFANLMGANLSGANLSRANLMGAYLSNADLSGANLTDANLSNADLEGAYLSYANLYSAYLGHANLTDANLSNADLEGAYLSYANLSNADLTGAYLIYANLEGAYLTGAYLAGVKANSRTICPNAYRWGTSGNDCGF